MTTRAYPIRRERPLLRPQAPGLGCSTRARPPTQALRTPATAKRRVSAPGRASRRRARTARSPPAEAASFDCTKAKTADEIAICQTQILSDLDTQMATLYGVRMQIPMLMGAQGRRPGRAAGVSGRARRLRRRRHLHPAGLSQPDRRLEPGDPGGGARLLHQARHLRVGRSVRAPARCPSSSPRAAAAARSAATPSAGRPHRQSRWQSPTWPARC